MHLPLVIANKMPEYTIEQNAYHYCSFHITVCLARASVVWQFGTPCRRALHQIPSLVGYVIGTLMGTLMNHPCETGLATVKGKLGMVIAKTYR